MHPACHSGDAGDLTRQRAVWRVLRRRRLASLSSSPTGALAHAPPRRARSSPRLTRRNQPAGFEATERKIESKNITRSAFTRRERRKNKHEGRENNQSFARGTGVAPHPTERPQLGPVLKRRH